MRIACLALFLLAVPLAAGEDALPAGATQRIGKPIAGYDGIVNALAFSADGTRLAIGRRSLGTEVYDLKSQSSLATVDIKGDGASSVAFSPDGELLYVGAYDALSVWEVRSGRKLDQGPGSGTWDLAISLDGKTAGNGTQNGAIQLWDLSQMRSRTLDRLGSFAKVAFSYDGSMLAANTGTRRTRIWDVASGKLKLELWGEAESWGVAFSPWMDVLATSSRSVVFLSLSDGAFRFEASIGKPVQGRLGIGIIYGSDSTLAFLPDASLVIWAPATTCVEEINAAGIQHRRNVEGIHLIDPMSARALKTFLPPDAFTSLALSPDGRTLATGQWDGVVYLWDLRVVLGGAGGPPRDKEAMREAWERMGGSDTAEACCASWDMSDGGQDVVTFLAGVLSAVPSGDAERDRLLSRLDDDDNGTREHATEALMRLGTPAIPALKEALKKTESPEARARIQRVLDTLATPTLHFSGDWAQGVRGVEVLGRIGSPSARDLLEQMAKGSPGAPETEMARRTLARLKR